MSNIPSANVCRAAVASEASWRKARIGLLGGSFNPAHDGHLHVSDLALDRLGLDYVWWLVSPQNPLKSEQGMAPLAERVAGARALARDARVIVTDIERTMGLSRTADVIRGLGRIFPSTRFVWLMGADNLCRFHRWRDWTRIFRMLPIAIFDRPTYSLPARASVAARRFAPCRLAERQARSLADSRPPAWIFLRGARHAASATAIRDARPAHHDCRHHD